MLGMRTVVAAGALAIVLAGSPALASCPPSYMKGTAGSFSSSTDALTISDPDHFTLSYDRGGDLLSVVCASNDSVGSVAYNYVRVVEALDVSGVTTGTVVPAVLELRLDGKCFQSCGASGCGVGFWGTLVVGADSVTADASIVGPTPPTQHTLAQTLSLPVVFTAGTPVNVQFLLAYQTGPGQVDANANGTGRWSVTGLPAGVTAVSCSGSTPAHTRTWGALKTHYR